MSFVAADVSKLTRLTLGNRVLVAAAITGDGSKVTLSATLLGLQRIDVAWLADAGDNAELYLTTYKGSSVVYDTAIGSSTDYLIFAIGY
jgi:hypothetical protein